MFNTRIRQHEYGLLFRYGDFARVLEPGLYWFWSRLFSLERSKVHAISTLETRFNHRLLDVLIENEQLKNRLVIVDLSENERALVWKNGRLLDILGSGRYAYWRRPATIEFETFNVTDVRFEHASRDAIVAADAGSDYFTNVEVQPYEEVLLFRNGELIDQLKGGKYVFWRDAGNIRCVRIDRRELSAEVSGQEIMTQDKVTLRLNLHLTYRVVDTLKAVTTVDNFSEAIYREAQLALRAAVGTRTLDSLLSDKDSVGQELEDVLRDRMIELGLEIRSIGLRDVILPGEMKTILNQVIEAEKQAQANLIHRREETAAARSQSNTAKLLAENPALARMKELEVLQEVLKGSPTTFFIGDGDILKSLQGLMKLDG